MTSTNSKTMSKDFFGNLIKIVQSLAIVTGIIFTYLEFKRYNIEKIEKENERIAQMAKDVRIHFYKLQLEYYAEAADATATLATEKIGSKDYKEAKKKFLRLFWGRLAIVEEKSVEARMMQFKNLLDAYELQNSTVQQYELEQASLGLAHDASRYTIDIWVNKSERKNYNR